MHGQKQRETLEESLANRGPVHRARQLGNFAQRVLFCKGFVVATIFVACRKVVHNVAKCMPQVSKRVTQLVWVFEKDGAPLRPQLVSDTPNCQVCMAAC